MPLETGCCLWSNGKLLLYKVEFILNYFCFQYPKYTLSNYSSVLDHFKIFAVTLETVSYFLIIFFI